MKRVIVASIDPLADSVYGASILEIFQSLSELGYFVRIIVPSSRNQVKERGHLKVETLRVVRWIPLATLVYLYVQVLRSILRERDLSAMLADQAMLPLMGLVRILSKSRTIMLNSSRPVGYGGILGRIRFLQFKFSLILARYFADAVTAISPMEAEDFSRLGHIPKDKMVVVASPVTKIFTRHLPGTSDELRRRLGLDRLCNKKVLLYYGSLVESRGIFQVLNVFSEAFENSDRVVLLVVGEGSARKTIERLILTKRIRNCVSMGPVPYSKMPEVISACDLGLVILPDHPWWRYQCPTKLIELLAMGKPVVASNLPGVRWGAGGSSLVTYINGLEPESFRAAVIEALRAPRRSEETWTYVERFTSENLAIKIDSIITPR